MNRLTHAALGQRAVRTSEIALNALERIAAAVESDGCGPTALDEVRAELKRAANELDEAAKAER